MFWSREPGAIASTARVQPVGATPGSEQAAGIRGSDLPGVSFPRPDPARIPAEDVLRFRALVLDQLMLDRGPSQPADSWNSGAQPSAAATDDSETFSLPVTPADRIAATLRHLSTLRGV